MTTQLHSLKFTIKRTTNELVLIVTGLWTICWVAAVGTILLTILLGLITDQDRRGDGFLIFIVILIIIIGLIVCRVFLWHLQGKEIVEIFDDEFMISHVGIIFPSIKRFEFSLIENVAYIDKQRVPRWIKFWGLGGGHIEFEYLGQKKYFGQTIEAKTAKEIISRLVERQKTTTH